MRITTTMTTTVVVAPEEVSGVALEEVCTFVVLFARSVGDTGTYARSVGEVQITCSIIPMNPNQTLASGQYVEERDMVMR